MDKDGFFRSSNAVMQTSEMLQYEMVEAFGDLDLLYNYKKTKFIKTFEFFGRMIFPAVALEMVLKEDESQTDTLVFIPENNALFIWRGVLEYEEITIKDTGKSFNLSLDDGSIKGKIMYSNNEICFKYEQIGRAHV